MSLQPQSKEFQQIRNSQIITRSNTDENGLRLIFQSDPGGRVEVPGMQNTLVGIHIGPSVQIACRRDGQNHRGLAVHGDIDIIPSGVPSIWEIAEPDTAFFLSIPSAIFGMVTEPLDIDASRVEIRNRFQIRDPQIENIGWALKAEMEWGFPNGRLYRDSLAIAVATRLVHRHSS